MCFTGLIYCKNCWINQLVNRLRNFIQLNLSETTTKYDFLNKCKHKNLNPRWKNLSSVALERGDLIPASRGFKGLMWEAKFCTHTKQWVKLQCCTFSYRHTGRQKVSDWMTSSSLTIVIHPLIILIPTIQCFRLVYCTFGLTVCFS
jgi:hypothetical protein